MSAATIEPVLPQAMNTFSIEPVATPTIEPLADVTTTELQSVETSSASADPVKKLSTTKKVVSTILTAVGAGALMGF